MALDFYNAKRQMLPSDPNMGYRKHFQEVINKKWLETTTRRMIKAETFVGSFKFEDIEVKINHALDKSTMKKIGNDFREIIFKDIEHNAPKGMYYMYNDSYWLCHNIDEDNRTSKNIMIRRCANAARWRSDVDGRIIEYPCIVEYDVTSPSPQVDDDIITPNNHLVMWIQGNEETYKLVRNMRLMFGEDPYKIAGYNKYLQNGIVDQSTPLLYLDLYLDEVSPYDDFADKIAYNGGHDYAIKIDQDSFDQVEGYSSTLTATVTDRGKVVNREVKWISTDSRVVRVDEDGTIQLVGYPDTAAYIFAQLGNNTEITDSIAVGIVDNVVDQTALVLSPTFDKVSQGTSVEFSANVYINNIKQDETVDVVASGVKEDSYKFESLGNNTFKVTCLKANELPLVLTFTYGGTTETYAIKLASMFGG